MTATAGVYWLGLLECAGVAFALGLGVFEREVLAVEDDGPAGGCGGCWGSCGGPLAQADLAVTGDLTEVLDAVATDPLFIDSLR